MVSQKLQIALIIFFSTRQSARKRKGGKSALGRSDGSQTLPEAGFQPRSQPASFHASIPSTTPRRSMRCDGFLRRRFPSPQWTISRERAFHTCFGPSMFAPLHSKQFPQCSLSCANSVLFLTSVCRIKPIKRCFQNSNMATSPVLIFFFSPFPYSSNTGPKQ